MRVPFLDLKAQYLSIQDEVNEAIQAVLDKTAFAGGPFVAEFEKNFAAYCQTEHAIGVSSGTSALWLALLALDIGEGDEVITVPNTFIATAEAISWSGAKPVLVDVDDVTYTMDPAKLEAAITPKTRAIIPVHLFGQIADMDPILDIARQHDLAVIEDACQAHGAEYQGKRAGSIGDIGCFSFYPGKNLGAYGEAGGISTNRGDLVEKMKMIRDHGQSQKYYHDFVGWNARMDGIQGAILNVKLRHIEAWTEARRTHAAAYSDALSDVNGCIFPVEADGRRHVYHVYALRVQNRDAVLESLKAKEIYCGIHYPVPLHLTTAYSALGHGKGTFPVSEQCADEFLSLPMFPELSEDQTAFVSQTVQSLI